MKDTDRCDLCGEVENAYHVFYFFPVRERLVKWMTGTIVRFCVSAFRVNPLRLLMFGFQAPCRKVCNNVHSVLLNYLYCMWVGRREGYTVDRTLGFLEGHLRC